MIMSDVAPNTLAKDLFEVANYDAMLKGHSDRFETWTKFLENNNLRHIYQDGEDKGAAFAVNLAKVKFPAEMPTLPNQGIEYLRARMIWQARDTRIKLAKSEQKFKQLAKLAGIVKNRTPTKQRRNKSLFARLRSKW